MRNTKLNKLTARKVKFAKDGTIGDGGGLYLRTRKGRSTWMFRTTVDGKSRDIGLGALSLTEARSRATEMRESVASGEILAPATPVAQTPTFREAMDRYLHLRGAEWSNSKHAAQWPSSLGTYAKNLMRMPVDQITTRDVAACLIPIWHTKQETASRVRQRIERILSATIALGERSGPNPAVLRDNLELVLGKQKQIVKHHAALPFVDAPECFSRMWQARDTGQGARGVLLVMLTALRSGEVRGLRWDDIDGDVITIPAERMKARRPHRVPITGKLAELLDEMPHMAHSPLILPSSRNGIISDATIKAAMKRQGYGAYTPHGFRSTFSDWAHSNDWPNRHVEDALAHTIGSAVERAYRRADYLEQRRPLMDSWERFLIS